MYLHRPISGKIAIPLYPIENTWFLSLFIFAIKIDGLLLNASIPKSSTEIISFFQLVNGGRIKFHLILQIKYPPKSVLPLPTGADRKPEASLLPTDCMLSPRQTGIITSELRRLAHPLEAHVKVLRPKIVICHGIFFAGAKILSIIDLKILAWDTKIDEVGDSEDGAL